MHTHIIIYRDRERKREMRVKKMARKKATTQKEEKEDETYKGPLWKNSVSPPGSRRFSRRLIETKSPEQKTTGNTRPPFPDISSTGRVAKKSKFISQDTCSASLSSAPDVPTTKEVGNKTPLPAQVPISPGNIMKSCTRATKLAPAHSRTGTPCQAKRGKFVQEKDTDNASEEESVNNSQPSLRQRVDLVQEKTTKEKLEEESKNHSEPSLTKRGSLIQENNANDTFEEEYDYNLQTSVPETGYLLQEKATNGPPEEEPENDVEPSLTKRGSLIQEKATDDNPEEEFEYNFQLSLMKTGNLLQEKTINGTPEEESENNFEPSLTKTGNLIQEKATIANPEEEPENMFQPCLAKRREFVQEMNTNSSPDEDNSQPCNSKNPTQVLVNNCSHELSLNIHTPSVSVMAITEIAVLNEKHPHDEEDEIVSCYKPALVTVGGYRVKEEFASLSRNILEKYGDILQNCILITTDSRSTFLEKICDIIQELQVSNFKEITTGELESMLKQVADMDTIRIEVDWLRKRLHDISEAMHKFVNSSLLKEKKDKIKKEVAEVERDLTHTEMILAHLKEKLGLLKSEDEEIERAVSDTSAKVSAFLHPAKCLVDGLL